MVSMPTNATQANKTQHDKKVVVVFPTKNEQATIEGCINAAKKSAYNPLTIVSDGHSSDRTREVAAKNGAEVVMTERRLHPGKGAAVKRGIVAALEKNPDVVVFLDADIQNVTHEWIDKLVDAIFKGGYDVARGMYLRDARDAPVTKLIAKPLLWTFFPEVSHYEQPLSGEVASKDEVWRNLLKREPPDGWGIDVWLLIESAMLGYKIKEVFLGTKDHRSFTTYADDVAKLSKMGEQVTLAIIQEAVKHERIDNAREINV